MYVLYQRQSESERPARDLVDRLARQQVDARLVEADSPEGQNITETYDLMDRPSAVLTQLDGTMVQRWEHELPLIEDVAYLAHN